MATSPGRKGVYVGLGLLGFAAIFLLLRHRATATPNNSPGSISTLTTTYNPNGTFNTSQVITEGSNPNLIMVSSANTNVNQYQNSSYLQALAAENNLSAALAAYERRINPPKVGTAPGNPNVNPGGPIKKVTPSTSPFKPGKTTLTTSPGGITTSPVPTSITPLKPTGRPVSVGPTVNQGGPGSTLQTATPNATGPSELKTVYREPGNGIPVDMPTPTPIIPNPKGVKPALGGTYTAVTNNPNLQPSQSVVTQA